MDTQTNSDPAIQALHDWLDAQNVAPPDSPTDQDLAQAIAQALG